MIRQPRIPEGLLVDESDNDLLSVSWTPNNKDKDLHPRRVIKVGTKRKKVYLHKIIMERILNRPLRKGEEVDHVDNNPLNNSRSNLRLATHQQNMWNQPRVSNNTSGVKGVHWNIKEQKWQARTYIDGKRTHLGFFDSLEEAKRVYQDTTSKIRGEFVRFE